MKNLKFLIVMLIIVGFASALVAMQEELQRKSRHQSAPEHSSPKAARRKRLSRSAEEPQRRREESLGTSLARMKLHSKGSTALGDEKQRQHELARQEREELIKFVPLPEGEDLSLASAQQNIVQAIEDADTDLLLTTLQHCSPESRDLLIASRLPVVGKLTALSSLVQCHGKDLETCVPLLNILLLFGAHELEGFTVLHTAAYFDCAELICHLLQRKTHPINPLAVGGDLKISALHVALDLKKIEAARALIDRRNYADKRTFLRVLSQRDGDERTPLHYLACAQSDSNYDRFAIELRDHGITRRTRDAEGRIPLHYACQKGNKAMVMILTDVGEEADQTVNMQDYSGATPLHYVAGKDADEFLPLESSDGFEKMKQYIQQENTRAQIIKVLRARGADVTVKDVDGKTPFDYARESKHSMLMNALKLN